MHRNTSARRLWAIRSLLGVFACLSACAWPAEAAPLADAAARSQDATQTPPLLAQALNRFGQSLCERLFQTERRNAVVYPFSLGLGLTMLSGGARNQTRDQIVSILGLCETDAPALRHLQETILGAGNLADAGVDASANALTGQKTLRKPVAAGALWLHEQMTLRRDFADFLAAGPRTRAYPATFDGDLNNVRLQINEWVRHATGGMEQNLLPGASIRPETNLVLSCALAFAASWREPFDPALTRPAPFFPFTEVSAEHRTDSLAPPTPFLNYTPAATQSDSVTVLMMHRTARLDYERARMFHAVRLWYADNECSLILILPRMQAGLAAAQDGLAGHPDWFRSPRRTVALCLPRFEIRDERDWSTTLSGVGMSDAFAPSRADFSGIAEAGRDPLYLRNVFHGCRIVINESPAPGVAATHTGTQAAPPAPASIAPEGTERIAGGIIDFNLERPFLFLIRHEPTKLALVIGRICNLPPAQ